MASIIANVSRALNLMGRYLQFATYFEIVKASLQKQLNVDMESVRHSAQALSCLVQGDLELLLPA